MTRIILLRHSQTDYNFKNRYCGISNIGLNKTGKIQAEKLRLELKDLKVDKVFCSNLKRSWQTAKIIFADRKSRIVKKRNFSEINFGEWEGLTFTQAFKRFPSTYKKWLGDPLSINIPAGERTNHFISRIMKEFREIVKNESDVTLALVIHSGAIRVILNSVLGIRKNDFWRLRINPLTGYVIEYKTMDKPYVYKLKWQRLPLS